MKRTGLLLVRNLKPNSQNLNFEKCFLSNLTIFNPKINGMLKATVDNFDSSSNKGTTFDIEIGSGDFFLNKKALNWDLVKIRPNYFHIIKDQKNFVCEVIESDFKTKHFAFNINGEKVKIKLKDRLDLVLDKLGLDETSAHSLKEIKAPMPGLILDILVQEGQIVEKGETLIILEAMKMENSIKSQGAGAIRMINIKKGDSVEKNQVLIQFRDQNEI